VIARRRYLFRHAPLAVLGLVVTVGLGACGTSGHGNQVVARVSGVGSIPEASLEHWARTEAILIHELLPTRPAPKGLVPDPPEYKACISYLRVVQRQADPKSSTITSSALRLKCRQEERFLRENALTKLISWYWIIGRAEALGFHFTGQQVRERLTDVVKKHTLYGDNVARYLRLTGETRADLLFRSRVQLSEVALTNKLTEIIKGLPSSLTEKERQASGATLINRIMNTKLWVSRTSCREGFVVSACRQYRGHEPPPGSAN
jgi:hypothetical protein